MPSTRSSLTTILALTLTVAQARAQAPGAELPAASTPAETTKLVDLTNRYRFSERYTRPEDRSTPGAVGAYRVGIVEVARDMVDTPRGAPRRMEATRQTIFAERPVELNGMGGVASSVRTFERHRARPEDPARMMGARPLEGLTAVVRPRAAELPLVLALTEGRSMTDYEFEVAARQVFAPHLAAVLPAQAVRLDDTWHIPRRAAQAMLGESGVQGDTLVGKFAGLRKEVGGPRLVAQVSISGKVTAASGESTVNAEILFTFQPESNPPAASPETPNPARAPEGVVEARGAITELRLARLTTAELPGTGRLRFRSHREIILHRQLGIGPEAAGPARLDAIPAPTEANSWLGYREPTGRFSFRHPQDLLPPNGGPVPPLPTGVVTMVRDRREGRDWLQIESAPRTLGPEALKQKLAAKWAPFKQDILPGEEQWLPEAEWPRMKVHRIEAAVKVADSRAKPGAANGSPRLHFDGYLVQFGQSASITAIATTSRDPAPFRREVEQILKSLQLGPAPPASP